ncbi:MAG: hypothetical protein R3B74_15490 [Nitrospirales bacterium]|nr:hypothetical protein [Nitrospirales bacterium]
MIAYVEEWEVSHPQDIQTLDSWVTEDVTLLQVLEQWEGDFFLLAGRYHTVFQNYQSVNTYCSIAHPWTIQRPVATLHPQASLWIGFRHTHGFIRVRLHTTEIFTPGESVESPREQFWLVDRQEAFRESIETLDLPIQVDISQQKVVLQTTRPETPFFCSWPDAFGPCQFEFNSPDPFEFLVPGSRLAATWNDEPANIRVYLTGFPEKALVHFTQMMELPNLRYRCSIHCCLEEIVEVEERLVPRGRIYGSLAEFQTKSHLPEGIDAAAIIGLVGFEGEFRLEIRLNQHPLSRPDTTKWLENLVEYPLIYAPLPAFP